MINQWCVQDVVAVTVKRHDSYYVTLRRQAAAPSTVAKRLENTIQRIAVLNDSRTIYSLVLCDGNQNSKEM